MTERMETLTVNQIAETYAVSVMTVRKWISSGELMPVGTERTPSGQNAKVYPRKVAARLAVKTYQQPLYINQRSTAT